MSEGAKLENIGVFEANSEEDTESEAPDISAGTGSVVEPEIVNKGTIERTEFDRFRGTTIGVKVANEGAIKVLSREGSLTFLGGGSSSAGSEWAIPEESSKVRLKGSSYSMSGSKWVGAGTLLIQTGVTAEGVEAQTGSVELQ
ncbi:MAG TPA: hypothetical protein VHT27_03000, partial [Solirubrobacteraceae bacterium]|nr:hypothetical protein [Solirubrobacteraceae bacterium]